MTMSNTPANLENKKPEPVAPRRPNEMGSVSIRAFVRIFDPKTDKTIVETQG